jgi:hypothetical protein
MTRFLRPTLTLPVVLLTVVLLTAVDSGRGAPESSWGASLTIRDPEPGFWRARPGASTDSVRPYSVGMSSLAATTRIAVAADDDLKLTNLGPSGVLILESGALVLANAEGPITLQRGGEVAGLETAPIGIGALLLRGDRITFHSSATVTFRNAEATAASVLLTIRIPDSSFPMGGVVQ